VPITVNVQSFMTKRLGSITMFKQAMQDAYNDRGRLRKEYVRVSVVKDAFPLFALIVDCVL
jgi:hypothetical protein